MRRTDRAQPSRPPGGHRPRLAERLRHKARRVTGPREAILAVLERQEHPVSIKEIFEALPAGDCDLATVYRAMHLLEQLQLVQRFDLGDRVARFELIREGHEGHHHHLVCRRCAGVVEIDECSIAAAEARIAARNGFRAVTHRLEFFGICPSCQ